MPVKFAVTQDDRIITNFNVHIYKNGAFLLVQSFPEPNDYQDAVALGDGVLVFFKSTNYKTNVLRWTHGYSY